MPQLAGGRSPYRANSRRATLSLSAAAAVLLAVPMLTACGSEPRPGAAAVVDGERITVAQVQSRAALVREAQRAAPQGEQLIRGTGQLGRATLDTMIRERVIEHAAREAGVGVTRREVQEARVQAERGAGGKRALQQMLLQQQAIAPGEINEVVRTQVRVGKLAASLGVDQRTPQGQAALMRTLSRTSAAMDVTVNPRYGEWSDKDVTLGTDTEPWLRVLPGRQRDAGGPA